MKKRILKNLIWVLLAMLCADLTVHAQGYFENAYRFGQSSPYGSVRSMGMGGVQMGTGADASALGTNPASPGMLRHSEFQFSLMPTLTSTTTSFENGIVDASRFQAPIGSFSIALNDLKDDIQPGDFRGGTFTLSYNRMALFNQKNSWEGTSLLSPKPGDTLSNSLIDYWLANVNKSGLFPSEILGRGSFGGATDDVIMAYRTYLLDVSQNRFISKIPLGDILKQGYWNQSLSQGIWNAGYSANFKDKIYVGASLGYLTCDFSTDLQYGEQWKTVVANPSDPSFAYLQRFKGFNYQITKQQTQTFKAFTGNAGILYKVDDAIRLSAAIQFPSIGWLNETYKARFDANYNGIPYWFNSSDPNDPNNYSLNKEDTTSLENVFSGKMTLPAKYRLGATYVIGKAGMFGIDLEYTDLSQTRLSEGDGNYSFSEENSVIRSQYRSTLNIRIGGELRFEDFRIRLGYAYYPTALKSNSNFINNIPSDAHYFSGGIGARYETWYWDVALVFGFWDSRFTYVPEIMKVAETKAQLNQLRMGLGLNF
jgi:hypothetical protein